MILKKKAILLLLIIMFLPGSIWIEDAAGKKISKREITARRNRAKARHFYLSASRYEAEGIGDAAADLYKRAYESDTSYNEAALQYGLRQLGMPSDSADNSIDRYSEIAGRLSKEYTGDLFSNAQLANMLSSKGKRGEYIRIFEELRRNHPANSDIVDALYRAYSDDGNYEKAYELVTEYGKLEGNSINVIAWQTELRMAMNDSVGAVKALDEWISDNPRDADGLMLKSHLELYMNKPDEALQTALRAEEMCEPNSGGIVKLRVAEIFRELGDSINYDSRIYDALMAEDLGFEAKRRIMLEYVRTLFRDDSDKSRADRLFMTLLQQYPHEPTLRELSSRYYATKKDYDKALEEIEYALDLDHTRKEYWNLALSYSISSENIIKLREIYERGLKNPEPLDLTFYILSGSGEMAADNFNEALKIFEKGLTEFFPGQHIDSHVDMQALSAYLTIDNLEELSSLYRSAGDAYYSLKEKDKSFVNYDNSLALNSDDALTLNNYAYFLVSGSPEISESELKKADEMSARAVLSDPGNPTYLDTRAYVLYVKGEYPEAKDILQRAIEDIRDSEIDNEGKAEYYLHYGDILYMLSLPEEALEAWETAERLNPENNEINSRIKTKRVDPIRIVKDEEKKQN